jgi:integrase
MASVSKRGTKWMARFRKADGGWTARVAGTDKGEAMRLANHWENEAKLRRAGLVDPRADAFKVHNQTKLAGHIDAYAADLLAKGCTAKHSALTAERVRSLLSSATSIADIQPTKINSVMKDLKESRGLSEQTASHYLRAVKLFTRWLWRDGRTREDALAGIKVKVAIAKADRKLQRRAFAHDEFAAIVRHVSAAGYHFCMNAEDRSMLYRVAAGTGLRASELASLTPESFHLAGDEPCVTVAAAYSKRGKKSGRDDVQPLPMDLAVAIGPWIKGRKAGSAVFTMPTNQHTAEMLRADVRTARARWIREIMGRKARRERRASDFLACVDASGHVVDFHALRHTFVSWLVGSGASVSVCQQLARHSTPVLTFNVYSHPTLADHRAAIERLPAMNVPSTEAEAATMRKTGTDDARPLQDGQIDFPRAANAQQTCGISGLRLAQAGTTDDMGGSNAKRCKTSEMHEFHGENCKGRSRIRTDESRICNPLP